VARYEVAFGLLELGAELVAALMPGGSAAPDADASGRSRRTKESEQPHPESEA
jgi:hypothetical protein